MSRRRLLPPEPPPCLLRRRPSSQKGGTLIAEDVWDRGEHEQRLCAPDGYRPSFCRKCSGVVLHVHDYRERRLRAEPGRPVARIIRHSCVACAAIWQTLPAFLARHLWRTWPVVERAMTGARATAAEPDRRAAAWPKVPERTQRRWRSRWFAAARFLVRIVAACGEEIWAALAQTLGLDATRADLVAAYAASIATPAGRRLGAVAALIDRLEPKVRLM